MKVFTLWVDGVEIKEALTSTETEKALTRIKSDMAIHETVDIKMKRLG